MARQITTVGFDADDTLWHNERVFQMTQARFASLLRDFAEPGHLDARLLAAERRNLGNYGYGIKGFMLSMIETAVEVTEGRVPGCVIREIIEAGQDMLTHPIELLPHAREAVERVSGAYRALLITKGDLMDQERKLAESGLGDMFDGVEIVSDKTVETYVRLFNRHGDGPTRAVMVGNSMRSDILPAIAAGSWGVHVPHNLAWPIEHAEPPVSRQRFREIADLHSLPTLLSTLA